MLHHARQVVRRRRRRRIAFSAAGGLALMVLSILLLGSCFAGPRWEGPPTDHFDGDQFRNQVHQPHGQFGDLLKWFANRDQGPWSEGHDGPIGDAPAERVDDGRLVVTWVGHSTLLVQVDGLNILTDPIWSERCSPVQWAGPRRVRPPAIRFEDLPPIDVVLLSHNHWDHFDLATVRRLRDRHDPKIFLGLGNAPLIEDARPGEVVEVDWWQEHPIGRGATIATTPLSHFSGRGIGDRDATLWVGYVVKTKSGNIFFSGDTGGGPHFPEVARRHGPLRLALLPIGAYKPEWFMHVIHVSPNEALAAHVTLGSRFSVAMHWGTFPLGDDGETEPVEVLRAALDAAPPRYPFVVPEFGRPIEVP